MTSVSLPQRPRAVFVDVLRLLAAIQMVQGHTLDALLAPPYRAGSVFEIWTFLRGLTSTTFLLTAGLSFALVTRRERDPRAGQRRRVHRAFQLIAVGYAMHLPVAVLFGMDVSRAMTEFLSVDVLQCIGVSLLLLELVAWAFSSAPTRTFVATALGMLCFLLAQAAASLVPEGPWFFLVSYVSPRGGSLFPLLPWTGYVLLGYGAGLWLFHDGTQRAARRSFALGVAALPVGLGLARALPASDPRVGPGFLVLKLALVLLVAALLAALFARVSRLPGLLTTLAGETLFLYVSHVLVLYAAHVGLKARVGSTLSPAEALAAAALLLFACSAGALAYRRAERALRAPRAGVTSAP